MDTFNTFASCFVWQTGLKRVKKRLFFSYSRGEIHGKRAFSKGKIHKKVPIYKGLRELT